jgi:hypothetical protein
MGKKGLDRIRNPFLPASVASVLSVVKLRIGVLPTRLAPTIQGRWPFAVFVRRKKWK